MIPILPLIEKMLATTVGEAVVNKVRKKPVLVPYDSKGLVKSKTAWGSTAALVMYLSQAGWPDSPAAWGAVASAVVVWVFTLYGRIKASGPIG